MSKFRKKPIVVEAVQWFGEPCSIETLEGTLFVSPGDWIITGVKGERSPCKPDIFAATYEPAAGAPTPLDMRPEVRAFAAAMEKKLRVNDHRPHWRGCDHRYLYGRLLEEVEELRVAALRWVDDQAKIQSDPAAPARVLDEAADVGNFAMMVADVCGALDAVGAPAEHARTDAADTEYCTACRAVREVDADGRCVESGDLCRPERHRDGAP